MPSSLQTGAPASNLQPAVSIDSHNQESAQQKPPKRPRLDQQTNDSSGTPTHNRSTPTNHLFANVLAGKGSSHVLEHSDLPTIARLSGTSRSVQSSLRGPALEQRAQAVKAVTKERFPNLSPKALEGFRNQMSRIPPQNVARALQAINQQDDAIKTADFEAFYENQAPRLRQACRDWGLEDEVQDLYADDVANHICGDEDNVEHESAFVQKLREAITTSPTWTHSEVDLLRVMFRLLCEFRDEALYDSVGGRDADTMTYCMRTQSSQTLKALVAEGIPLNDIYRKHPGNEEEEENEAWSSPLQWTCEHGGCDFVRLLLKLGADVDFREQREGNNQSTPLMIAAKRGDLDIVDLLLQHGANPLLTDPNGLTPETLARNAGKAEVVQRLQIAMQPAPNGGTTTASAQAEG